MLYRIRTVCGDTVYISTDSFSETQTATIMPISCLVGYKVLMYGTHGYPRELYVIHPTIVYISWDHIVSVSEISEDNEIKTLEEHRADMEAVRQRRAERNL